MIKIKNLLDKIRKNTKPLESTDSSLENNLTQRQFFLRMSHEISSVINQILGIDEDILQREDASDEIRRDDRSIALESSLVIVLRLILYLFPRYFVRISSTLDNSFFESILFRRISHISRGSLVSLKAAGERYILSVE